MSAILQWLIQTVVVTQLQRTPIQEVSEEVSKMMLSYIPPVYSLKFSRVKIFEDFKDFCLASKILTLKILVLHRHLLKNLAKPRKFNHENFFLKEKSLNLEIFNPRKF